MLLIRMTSRNYCIIDFREPISSIHPGRLSAAFAATPVKKMMYAAGDGFGGYTSRASRTQMSNIEFFYKTGFNIFCYLGSAPSQDAPNMEYLTRNNLPICVCIVVEDDQTNYQYLRALFPPNSLDMIDTDDHRWHVDSRTAFHLLKPGGLCVRVTKNAIVGHVAGSYRSASPPDWGWGEPNFATERTMTDDDFVPIEAYNFIRLPVQSYTEHTGLLDDISVRRGLEMQISNVEAVRGQGSARNNSRPNRRFATRGGRKRRRKSRRYRRSD
jgi:hypothetical protein